jgi:hypothetical protein
MKDTAVSYETLIATQETGWLNGTAGHKVKDIVISRLIRRSL